jgi:hypothetical protein
MAALEKEREQRESGGGAHRGAQRRAKWGSPTSGGGGPEGGRQWLRDGYVPHSPERDGNVAGFGDVHTLARSVAGVSYAGKQLEMEEKLFTVLFMEAQQVSVCCLVCVVCVTCVICVISVRCVICMILFLTTSEPLLCHTYM